LRLVTCEYKQMQTLGVVLAESVALTARLGSWPRTMLELIDGGPDLWARLAKNAPSFPDSCKVPLSEVKLRAPIPVPRKNVMCLGWNYADHSQEASATRGKEAEIPEHPVVFTKNVTSVNDPYGDIPFDASVTTQLDWEVELTIVIGIGGRGIAPQQALRHVFGYTVTNDVSARDIQFRHKQYFLGKSLEGACPMGPMIVTADEIPDPQTLDIRSWVNGVEKQSSNTRHQIFNVATTVSILSRGMRLEPGDLIATGTPSGVGFARKPPEFMKPGDVVECEVEKIGKLKNKIVERR
jgi:2-keto-4-pentenoate hydratase/2-oxohepta-3-ene-1,7-dioic acid hydratase in catechol pathway